jgi:hypothetical protein
MADMKPRHAVALALVGWYLMLPPLQFVGPANDPYSLAIVDSAALLIQEVSRIALHQHEWGSRAGIFQRRDHG